MGIDYQPQPGAGFLVAINSTNPATKNLQPPLQSRGKQAYTNRPRSVKSPEENPCVFPEKKISPVTWLVFFNQESWGCYTDFLKKIKLFNKIPKHKIPCRIEIWVELLIF